MEGQQNSARRWRAYVSAISTTQLHLRNPFIIALWSAIFPGAGHILLSKNLRGFILFVWEIVINQASHLNEAILYTFLGRFDIAKEVLDIRWFMLYSPVYLFAVWDSYRMTVDLNNQFLMAAREDAEIRPFRMNALTINYLDKSSPWAVTFWSILAPGAGQLIIHRIIHAFFLLAWWIAVVYFSKLLPAIHYTFLGMIDRVKTIVNPQWLLNIPSIYLFAIYDAYVNTVEGNKLFEWEQAKFLKTNYQNRSFTMPFSHYLKRSGKMYIVSDFEHSIKLEMAVTALEAKGIRREDILAVPMCKQNSKRMLFDHLHSSDNHSLLDLPLIMGATFAVFGVIYGFVLSWGPVAWALIGTAFGMGSGLLIKLAALKKRRSNRRKDSPDVVLIIACEDAQTQMVQDILWENSALGVAALNMEEEA